MELNASWDVAAHDNPALLRLTESVSITDINPTHCYLHEWVAHLYHLSSHSFVCFLSAILTFAILSSFYALFSPFLLPPSSFLASFLWQDRITMTLKVRIPIMGYDTEAIFSKHIAFKIHKHSHSFKSSFFRRRSYAPQQGCGSVFQVERI